MPGIEFIQDLAVVITVAGVVGWVCHRLRLSVVVGYLVAGMVVGPYTPPFSLVHDTARIATLAQVGLVFLVFSIGMRLSLRRLRQLGLPLLIATVASAVIVFNLVRLAGAVLGLHATGSFFLASMLMISSSAVISKVLTDGGVTHEKFGQLATGMAVLEDVVAVVMLTLLSSYVQFGRGGAVPLGGTLGRMGAFVVLAGVGGLLLVPGLLRRLSVSAAEELQTLVVTGLLFTMALLAQRAGYSLALGAFLLGAIVAETPHRTQVDRAFEGMRDVFSAVFFVAIGMQIDGRELGAQAGLIVGVAALAIVVRAFAGTLGFVATGTDAKVAMRVGLAVTPIGEFSFIIAQMGVAAGAVPKRFYPLAVGVSLLTTLAAPMLTRNSDAVSTWLVARQPGLLKDWIDYYQRMLERLRLRARRNRLWQLSRRRLWQIAVEVLFVSGLLVFSERLFGVAESHLGRGWLFPHDLETLFWSGLILVTLAPLVAIWRNLSALALLYAEVSTGGTQRAALLRPVVETALKALAGGAVFLWLSAVVPLGGFARWLLAALTAVAVVALVVLWRRLIYWHSEVEVELGEILRTAGGKGSGTTAPWVGSQDEWHLNISECVLPDLADCRGRTLEALALRARFGCSVVGIERQGFMLANPAPATAVFPRDRILLLGSAGQVAAAKRLLTAVSPHEAAGAGIDEVRMEAMVVPAQSRCAGGTLASLEPQRRSGIQIVGINRDGRRILNPGSTEVLQAGDEVLVLGSPGQIAGFRAGLEEGADQTEGAPG